MALYCERGDGEVFANKCASTEEKRNTGAMKDITEPVRKPAVEQLLERVILHGMQSKSINVCEYVRRRKTREKYWRAHVAP